MTSILKADTIQDTDGNNIINESSNTITIGASGDTITIPSGATITNSGTASGFGGITMAQQYRLTTSLQMATSGTDITANLEVVDSDGYGGIGSSMSESSGIFTFPSTGIYLIEFNGAIQKGSTDYAVGQIKTTVNNSSYDSAASGYAFSTDSNKYASFNAKFMFDVTDTSTHKVKFAQYKQGSNQVDLIGDTTRNDTHFTFLRLGDT
jgi:hypothetical protein